MAKKKSSSKKGFGLAKILYLVAAVLGVVAVVMLFVDNVKVPDTDLGILGTVEGTGYTGLQVAFGSSEKDVEVLAFSFMALLPYLLVIGGVVLSALGAFAKKGSKILDYVSIALYVVAGVLFFIMPNFMVFADTLLGVAASKLEYVLTTGAVVAAVCSLLSGATVLVKNLLKK